MPALPSLIDLASLGTLGNVIQGAEPSDGAGFSVSSAGDVNGDGFDDVIVGAPLGAAYYGAAYILFGDANGISDTDLGALAPTDGFRIVGNSSLSFTGCSVSSAGDVNDDGYADIIVGARFANLGDGAAYLIFGKAAGFADIDLAALDPADGFTIAGTPASYAGDAVSSGDVNGDGFTDLIVGARADGVVGAAYVVFGKASGFADVDLATLGSGDGFAIRGIGIYDQAGFSVASADVNGDGYADVLVGAPNGAGSGGGSGNYEGRVYVIFGKASGLGDVDLATLAPADGFAISGADPYDYAGYAVASAGDINGDGFDEIIVSSPYEGATDPGAVFVIFGKSAGFADLDLGALAPADGFAIRGEAADDHLGFSLSGAGDVNGDGFADLLVGALNSGALDAGSAYLIYGKAGGFSDVDLAALDPADGVIIRGAEDGDLAGNVSSAGDVDGDGFDDLMVGARSGDLGGADSGQAYIIYGIGQVARDDAFAINENAVASGSLFGDNGFGADAASRGLTLEIAEVNGSAANVGIPVFITSNAELTVNADGSFTYDPNVQFRYLISAATALATGAVNTSAFDTFTYILAGGGMATATITINGVDSTGDELRGDAGDNVITDTVDIELFNLSQGGNDSAFGLANGDLFNFGAAFTAADSVDGGAGDDELFLQGDYATVPLVLAATSLVSVERINLIGGFSYDIASNDANVAAGQTLTVEGFTLGPLETIRFDGSAETDGRFILIGSDGNDELTGGGRDDRLFGAAGDNILDGGAGNGDTLDYNAAPGAVTVDLSANLATENGFGGQDQLLNVENILGSDFDDILTGDGATNVINGGPGADTMTGGNGNDAYVVDNAGDQAVEGSGGGIDIVRSSVSFTLGANVESLDLVGIAAIDGTGSDGANTLTGNLNNNVLDGGLGADFLRGGLGNDTYVVDEAGDVVSELAGQGTDLVQSSISYTLAAGVENLTLTGAAAINGTGNIFANVLIGNDAANLLDGRAGADAMSGGLGDDVYVVDNAGDTVTELPGAGTDEVRSSVTFTLGANIETLVLTGVNAINGTGNDLDNSLTGNGAANLLDGGLGADTMTGGLGNDTYVIDNIGDVAIEAAGGGTDTIRTLVTHILAAQFENLTLLGTDDVNGTGNDAANVLTGNSGANSLDGLAGADTMAGGGGNDSYAVDNSLDKVIELAGGGTDTVSSTISYTLTAEVENLVLTGLASVGGTGNALANSLTGNEAGNALNGGAGADVMSGGLGNDSYTIDQAGDVVVELAGQGTDTVKSAIDFTLVEATENLILLGTGNLNGTGNGEANILTGNSGANLLDGGAGADTMNAGLGNDTYIVDHAGDLAFETSTTGGTDEVQSSVSHSLTTNIDNLTLTGAGAINGTGNALGNVITGNGAANLLSGLGGNDALHGGGGIDQLRGGAGDDGFYFESALEPANLAAILDFVAVNDTISLDDSVFTALAAGPLAPEAFRAGAAALDADDRILYDSATGQILYDADGDGAGASAILFATVTPGTAVTNADFVVF